MKTNEIVASASSSRSDMLRDVRGFIERGWTQGVPAHDEHGELRGPDEPDAVCWCIYGAAFAANVNADDLAHSLGLDDLSAMIRWNDEPGRTQADVLRRIDQALERAGCGE